MNVSFASRLTSLPDGFVARPTTKDDVAACTQVLRDVDIASCGETTSTELEVAADIFSPLANGDRGTAVICQGNEVVAFINTFDEMKDNRGLFFDIFESPKLNHQDAVAISIELINNVEKYTADLMREYGIAEAPIKTALYDSDLGFLEALEKTSYNFHRTFWRMKKEHLEELLSPAIHPDYELCEYEASEEVLQAIHKVNNLAFEDYYDFNPKTFESWKKWVDEPMNDPDLWRLIRHEGQVVGFIMGNKRFEEEEYGYVAVIGVLREHRGKGLARTLLLDMFKRDQERGMQGTILHGDSSNPTGAMKLYESVGMRTDRIYRGYRKEFSI